MDAFIREHLRVEPVAFVPELSLHQAEEPIGLWELTEGAYHSDQPPPFWAFAWAGGQALARYLLDHPDEVKDRAVLDLASGSGLTAIAAARCGARSVRAVEIDPIAVSAIGLNAVANDVRLDVTHGDILAGEPGDVDLILAGDVFYSKEMSDHMLTFLRRAARSGVDVLVGDPERAYFPHDYFIALQRYEVPVRFELESVRSKATTVWRIKPRGSVKA